MSLRKFPLNLIENKDDSWEKFVVFMLQYFLFVLTSEGCTIKVSIGQMLEVTLISSGV